MNCQLIDFGCAKYYPDKGKDMDIGDDDDDCEDENSTEFASKTRNQGTYGYMAPE